jgi:hypothetical protein
MKKILLSFMVFLSVSAGAQNVAGYWYGTANPEFGGGNNYLIEIILNQNKTSVNGIMNCYFKNTFRSFKVSGSFNSLTREVSLFNIAIPYAGSANNLEVDCMMDFNGRFLAAVAGSSLTGKFTGREGYKYTCPEIAFDLRLNKDAGNQDSIMLALQNFKETYQVWSPTATDTLVSAVVQQRTIQNFVVNKEFKERDIEIQQEIEVSADSILVDFYDNGEVDGDSISVFFNGQLYGANLRLSTKAIHMNIKLDTTLEVNTLAMFANNLGTIPPNTALMLVYDGKKRYEVRIMSNLEKSGAIRIRRKKP